MTHGQGSTTGIGSLPHHNVDAALDFSFRMGIPFLPQIPIRNPWEFMIAQALEGIPGLQAESDGTVTLHRDVWASRSHALNQRLAQAFDEAPHQRDAFEGFEPSAAISSSWQPFLWELQERGARLAKLQLAGPMTAQWALKVVDSRGQPVHEPGREPGNPIDTELQSQVFRLLLARALAMTRRLQAEGIQPIFYLDEPGLYGLSLSNPRHVLGYQELKLVVQTLRKEGVQVGIHCCSNTDWAAVLNLGVNLISLDTQLSLESFLNRGEGTGTEQSGLVEFFVRQGGRLSLGVIPTGRPGALHSLTVKEIFAQLMDAFSFEWASKPELVKKVLLEAIYTPACGLALQSVSDAELALEKLTEFAELCSASLMDRTMGSA